MKQTTANDEPKVRKHAKRLISPSHVRAYLLDIAKAKRAHKFTRVSKATLDELEADLRAKCLIRVERAPSKGQTL
ncbi:MAG: hypothetical protein P4L99_27925 [Chthoniobacter sp.]|nr:hypothetical protein [Chthoniobacter sp.]